MKGFKSSYFTSLLIFMIFVGVITVLPVAADEEDRPSDPNVVRGFIANLGRNHVQIDEERYKLSRNTLYFNEEGVVLRAGKTQMKTDMKVDLLMEEGMVVKVIIYGLLRR